MAEIEVKMVDAPTFTGVNALMAAAAKSQNDGFKSLQETLKGTQTAIRGQNTEKLMNYMNQANTADQFNEASFQDGLNRLREGLGGEYNREEYQTQVQAMPGQLLDRGLKTTQLTQANNTLHDSPIRGQVAQLLKAGKNAEAQALMANMKTDYSGLITMGDEFQTSALQREGARQNITMADNEWGLMKEQHEYKKRMTDALLALEGGNFAAAQAILGGNWGNGEGGEGQGGGGTAPTNSAPMKVGDYQNQAITAMRKTGWNDNVIAGFLGNFEVEGGYTGATGDNGTAHGIAQWRGDRKDNFVKMFGKVPSKASVAEQIQFVEWELKNPGKAGMKKEHADAILNASSPQIAARLIDKYYERSDGTARSKREEFAGRFHSNLGGGGGQQAAPKQQASTVIPPTLARPQTAPTAQATPVPTARGFFGGPILAPGAMARPKSFEALKAVQPVANPEYEPEDTGVVTIRNAQDKYQMEQDIKSLQNIYDNSGLRANAGVGKGQSLVTWSSNTAAEKGVNKNMIKDIQKTVAKIAQEEKLDPVSQRSLAQSLFEAYRNSSEDYVNRLEPDARNMLKEDRTIAQRLQQLQGAIMEYDDHNKAVEVNNNAISSLKSLLRANSF